MSKNPDDGGWGRGYLAEGARGSSGPDGPVGDREVVSAALTESFGEPIKLTPVEEGPSLSWHIHVVETVLKYHSDVPWPSLAKVIEAARSTIKPEETDD